MPSLVSDRMSHFDGAFWGLLGERQYRGAKLWWSQTLWRSNYFNVFGHWPLRASTSPPKPQNNIQSLGVKDRCRFSNLKNSREESSYRSFLPGPFTWIYEFHQHGAHARVKSHPKLLIWESYPAYYISHSVNSTHCREVQESKASLKLWKLKCITCT